MRVVLLLLLSFIANQSIASNLEKARKLFFRIEESRNNALELQHITAQGVKNGNLLLTGYHAVATANLALHTIMPISKYNYFRQGRDMIEDAILQMPDNVELRFLRLTIQIGTPAFLNYNHHIATDREMILAHLEKQAGIWKHEAQFWSMVLVYLRDRSRPDQASRARILKLMESNTLT
ncbi:MAG: hypothetical protein LWX09_08585 [Bacteroidia bacterium]|jgi:hypothetical protein|nr:hypothetical protein [Bacteroidia bacterium]